MIHEVDESLRLLMRREALQGADIEILFDAPTKDWAGRRNTPTIDVYLYDVREDSPRRSEGQLPVRNAQGFVEARKRPARYYKLSYLVTAWTQRAEDEHRLLSAVLAAFVKYDAIPQDMLAGSLAESAKPVYTTIALPPPQDRSIGDIWSAMGGELKPSLDLVVHAPFDPGISYEAGPPVLESPSLGFSRPADGDPIYERGRTPNSRVASLTRRTGGGPAASPAARAKAAAARTRDVYAAREGRAPAPEPAVKGRGAAKGKAAKAGPPPKPGSPEAVALAAAEAAEAEALGAPFIEDAYDDPIEHEIAEQVEEVLLSNPEANGRVFRMRGLPRPK